MSDFRAIDAAFSAAPQIAVADVAEAKAQGFTTIVNNRPEGEADDQSPGPSIEAAAHAAGLAYYAIPVAPGGFSEAQVAAMADALQSAEGPVLAYCRSGTRSTNLWALARAALGDDPDRLVESAARGGYDLAAIRPLLDRLASRRG